MAVAESEYMVFVAVKVAVALITEMIFSSFASYRIKADLLDPCSYTASPATKFPVFPETSTKSQWSSHLSFPFESGPMAAGEFANHINPVLLS